MNMEERILFKKGKQRELLNLAIARLNCFSVRGILQYGFDIKYSSLKSYYSERRLISRSFFENLCHIAKIDKKELRFEIINGNWGQVKGGKISKR